MPNEARAAAFFQRLRDVPFPGVTQEGNVFKSVFRGTSSQDIARYTSATGFVPFHEAPSGMGFMAAWEPTIEAIRPHLLEAKNWSVLHVAEKVKTKTPLALGTPWIIEVKATPLRGGLVKVERSIKNYIGLTYQTAETTLMLGGDLTKLKFRPAGNLDLLGSLVHTEKVTPELISKFANGSGDFNPVHMNDQSAKALGLSGRILHGMATYNFGELALMAEGGLSSPAKNLAVKFTGIARGGDTLSFHRILLENGSYKISTVNQEGHLIMEMLASA